MPSNHDTDVALSRGKVAVSDSWPDLGVAASDKFIIENNWASSGKLMSQMKRQSLWRELAKQATGGSASLGCQTSPTSMNQIGDGVQSEREHHNDDN